MICEKCGKIMKKAIVEVEGAVTTGISYQCECGNFQFDKTKAVMIVDEIREKEMQKNNG